MSHRMRGSTPLERTTRHGLDCVCVGFFRISIKFLCRTRRSHRMSGSRIPLKGATRHGCLKSSVFQVREIVYRFLRRPPRIYRMSGSRILLKGATRHGCLKY